MANNKEKDYEKIYNEYKSLVAFIASIYLKSSSKIDDVVQETFLELFKNIDKVTDYKAYLSTVAKNTAIKMDKLDKENVLVPSMDDFSVENIRKIDSYSMVVDELSYFLSTQEISIIIVHLFGGYTFKEIGEKANVNKKTVQTIYYRALKKCQKGGFLK